MAKVVTESGLFFIMFLQWNKYLLLSKDSAGLPSDIHGKMPVTWFSRLFFWHQNPLVRLFHVTGIPFPVMPSASTEIAVCLLLLKSRTVASPFSSNWTSGIHSNVRR